MVQQWSSCTGYGIHLLLLVLCSLLFGPSAWLRGTRIVSFPLLVNEFWCKCGGTCWTWIYRIAEKFGRELNLVVWWSTFATAKLKSANISYLHVYVWWSLTELPNLNLPIFLQWRFGVQLPNLIPANISGYTVHCYWIPKVFGTFQTVIVNPDMQFINICIL